jgi:hypothetical protein
LGISYFTVKGLERAVDEDVIYCGDWNIKGNLNKYILICRQGDTARGRRNERLTIDGQTIEVRGDIHYLGVTLGNRVG